MLPRSGAGRSEQTGNSVIMSSRCETSFSYYNVGIPHIIHKSSLTDSEDGGLLFPHSAVGNGFSHLVVCIYSLNEIELNFILGILASAVRKLRIFSHIIRHSIHNVLTPSTTKKSTHRHRGNMTADFFNGTLPKSVTVHICFKHTSHIRHTSHT